MKDLMFHVFSKIYEEDNTVYLMRRPDFTNVTCVRKDEYDKRILTISFGNYDGNQVFVGLHEDTVKELINDLKRALEQKEELPDYGKTMEKAVLHE